MMKRESSLSEWEGGGLYVKHHKIYTFCFVRLSFMFIIAFVCYLFSTKSRSIGRKHNICTFCNHGHTAIQFTSFFTKKILVLKHFLPL